MISFGLSAVVPVGSIVAARIATFERYARRSER
jgi:hypothetical protein